MLEVVRLGAQKQNKMSYQLQEDLRIVGKFMGKNFKDPLNYMYDKKWEWLMPVIEKISAIEFHREMQDDGNGNYIEFIHTHYPRTFGMISPQGKFMFRFNSCQLFEADTLIEAAWLAVVDFVKSMITQPVSDK